MTGAAARTDVAEGGSPPAREEGPASQRARAPAVLAAVERLARESGVTLPAGLRLRTLADAQAPDGPSDGAARSDGAGSRMSSDAAGHDQGPADDLADALGGALESATTVRQRRSSGLHVTPQWLAQRLVELALGADGARPPGGDPIGARGGAVSGRRTAAGRAAGAKGAHRARSAPTVCDPACGGGAFLVASAAALHARGVSRRAVVRDHLWGADIDPVGLAAAEAALALWSGGAIPPPGRLVVGDPLREGAGVWPDRPPEGFGLVAGNPPFQSQLARATARDGEDQRRLRQRFGEVVRAYTDTAWLFLLLGCELARPDGRVVLLQPESVMAARDAARVRDAADRVARLVDLWVDDRHVFAARVRVCAPVLRVHGSDRAAGPQPTPSRWSQLLADATGIPPVALVAAAGRLADRAEVIAGFRDQYYGLVPLVREAEVGERAALLRGAAAGTGSPGDGPRDAVAPLVTSGGIEWGRSAWGRRPLRFAKRGWQAPVVDLGRLDATGTTAARRWIARTRRPKILVATQTNVVEVAVDEVGGWAPSVPVLAVLPGRPDQLWLLAAALASPAATAWLARRTPGAGMHRGALKVSRRDLEELPLPTDGAAWEAAAAALRELVAAADPRVPGADGLDRTTFERFVAAAAAAYGTAPALVDWWRRRLRVSR